MGSGAVLLCLLAVTAEYRALFFTASWCEPCRPIQSILKRIETEDKEKRVEVVIIDFDRQREESEARWGVRGIPVVLVFDRDGRLVFRAEGASPETRKSLESALRALIQPKREKSK